MSADKNLVSHQTWCLLGKLDLSPTTKFVQKSAHVFGDCLGIIEIFLQIGDHSEKAKFFVMALGNLHEEMVLSRTWMAKRNCTIGWKHRHISFFKCKSRGGGCRVSPRRKGNIPRGFGVQGKPTKETYHTPITYKDKGKAKEEFVTTGPAQPISTSPIIHNCPNDHLTKEKTASSTTTATILNGTQKKSHQRSKVYQPKYPSLRDQQRRMQQAFVPKHMVHSCRLSDGDTHRWVERQATNKIKSSGWLTTQMSLEAQGYNQGNRELWLPKPEFQTYKVPSKTPIPTRRRQSRRSAKQKHKKPKQRRQRMYNASTFDYSKANATLSRHGSLKTNYLKCLQMEDTL